MLGQAEPGTKNKKINKTCSLAHQKFSSIGYAGMKTVNFSTMGKCKRYFQRAAGFVMCRENDINIYPQGAGVATRYKDLLYVPGMCLVCKLCEGKHHEDFGLCHITRALDHLPGLK